MRKNARKIGVKKRPYERKTESIKMRVRPITKERWYEALEHALRHGFESPDQLLGFLITLYWKHYGEQYRDWHLIWKVKAWIKYALIRWIKKLKKKL